MGNITSIFGQAVNSTLWLVTLTIGISILLYSIYSLFNLVKDRSKDKGKVEGGETLDKRIDSSVKKLHAALKEADDLVQGIVRDIQERQSAVAQLQKRSNDLRDEENKTKQRIETLKDIPLPVAEYFESINRKALDDIDKKRKHREFGFFIAGIIVTVGIEVILRLFHVV